MYLSWGNQLSQSAAINAQAIQSLKLLQFSREELDRFIKEQSERNPLVDVASEGDTNLKRIHGPEQRVSGASTRSANGLSQRQAGGSDHTDMLDRVAAPLSLRDHLRLQLGPSSHSREDSEIAIEIIESLDDDGYLRRPLHAIADLLGHSETRVEAVLADVQRMDPAGVGARSLAECLTLQLRDSGALTPAMERMLAHLPLLARCEYRGLALACGVDVAEIVGMAERIRRLDPRPGNRFEKGPIQVAVPDVLVEVLRDGSTRIELNAHALPRVLVDRRYHARIKSGCRDPSDERFLVDCLRDANWLVRNLDQRARTILKVASEIVDRQHEFLVHGVERLKPLNLKEVADAVGVHPSTVSRAISNKYVLTPQGLRELKFFFAQSIASVEGGASVSSDTVQHRIRRMIGDESPDDVLSDDAIVKRLRTAGVDIARRTVAKYREAMNIPSSLQRRNQKSLGLALSRFTPGRRLLGTSVGTVESADITMKKAVRHAR